MSSTGHQTSNDATAFKEIIKEIQAHIALLRADLDSYKQHGGNHQSYSIASASPGCCLCGVTNIREENMRLRQGLVAKHNEVVQLRGLMMNQPESHTGKTMANGHGSNRPQFTPRLVASSASPQAMVLVPGGVMMAASHSSETPALRHLAAGGVCPATGLPCPTLATIGGGGMRLIGAPAAFGGAPDGSYCSGGGTFCNMPCCPHGPKGADVGAYTSPRGSLGGGFGGEGSTPATGTFNQLAMATYSDTNSPSATAIMEESKRQMEQTESEIKTKLQEINTKKNALEEDINILQKVLLEKQQTASNNIQAGRAAKANELANAAQMVIHQQQQQRKLAEEAAKAAMQLKEAQDEQARKQVMVAKAAEMAQQAQHHQLMMASQAVLAAERAEEAQREQAAQAEEAAHAAEAVKAAQEEQNRLASKQLQDAEQLERTQEEQTSKTSQATEALHAAHVAQAAQQAQAYHATTEAHTVLMQHKLLPSLPGYEDTERGVRVDVTGPVVGTSSSGGYGRHNICGPCCNPHCPNNKKW